MCISHLESQEMAIKKYANREREYLILCQARVVTFWKV
nr:MAG TPA: hypothetical protein [Caudoviricetes sp.]